MPDGTPLFVKVNADGSLQPYYEGHFFGRVGGNVSAVGIDARERADGQISAPEYYPDHLTYQGATPAPVGGRPGLRPVAGMWAEYPSPTRPVTGDLLNEKLNVRVTKGTTGPSVERKLLDINGNSDFLPAPPVVITGYLNWWQAFPGYQMTAHKLGRLVFINGLMSRPAGAPAWTGAAAFDLPYRAVAPSYVTIPAMWYHNAAGTFAITYCYCPVNSTTVTVNASGFVASNADWLAFNFFYPTDAP